MHMADALISPAVGGAMWATTAGLGAYCARKVAAEPSDRKVPLMAVLGAFVFAAQMVNFSIPGTGSSGHLGGGLMLAMLLGPEAAFLTIASVLVVQALFFADGGLLALGCNVFNMGVFPCLLAYPWLYRPIAGRKPTQGRIAAGAMAASVVGLQLGALGVVVEALVSGITALPLGAFLLLMQPVHLAIGLVEGVVTAAVVTFVWRARPEVVELAGEHKATQGTSWGPVLAALGVLAVLTGAVLSWFASANPDGLEWSLSKASGKEELQAPQGGVHQSLARLQEKTAVLPDYAFPAQVGGEAKAAEGRPGAGWPAPSAGTSVSGLVGGMLTLLLVGSVGLALRRRRRR